jgi:prephenate dehydrogenase
MSPNGTGARDGAGLAGTTVAVVGLGLVGGSLVRALARLPEPPRVLGASPDAADREGAERDARAHTAADAADLVGEADVVVYAAPLAAIVAMLPAHARAVRADALVTDVAGLKRPVLEAAARAGLGDRFVGAHPLAGGEGSGFAGGRADLFRGARVFLCADAAQPSARARAESLWRAVDARPTWVGAEDHDRLMVKVSHLPQLVANALALTLEEQGIRADELGPGGRDMTRLAESPPKMWADLLAHTGVDAAGLLRGGADRLEDVAVRLERGDGAGVADLMARTRAWRARPDRAEDGERGQRGETEDDR